MQIGTTNLTDRKLKEKAEISRIGSLKDNSKLLNEDKSVPNLEFSRNEDKFDPVTRKTSGISEIAKTT